jgi:hypothetical protein
MLELFFLGNEGMLDIKGWQDVGKSGGDDGAHGDIKLCSENWERCWIFFLSDEGHRENTRGWWGRQEALDSPRKIKIGNLEVKL